MDLKGVEKSIQLRVDSNFHFVDNRGKDTPFTPLKKTVSQSKIAIISSGGFHLKDDKPFDTNDILGDITFRIVPMDVKSEDLNISHTHYKHENVKADLNCGLPSEILIDFKRKGYIGSLAQNIYTFSGYIIRFNELINEMAPKIINLLKDEQVDAVILAPT